MTATLFGSGDPSPGSCEEDPSLDGLEPIHQAGAPVEALRPNSASNGSSDTYTNVHICMCMFLYIKYIHVYTCKYIDIWMQICDKSGCFPLKPSVCNTACVYTSSYIYIYTYRERERKEREREREKHMYAYMFRCVNICICMYSYIQFI